MANQSNPIQFQSINLLNQTASFIITRDLQNSENVDDYDRSDVNSIITGLWSKLKHSPQDFSLKHIMSNIEKSFAMEQQKMRGITFSSEQLKDLITNNVNVLFKELAEKFQAKQIFGNHIPVDISSYERLQRIWEDEALQKIWDSDLAGQFVFNGPAPTSPGEIKAWLKDPANAMQLNDIQKLELSGLKLRAIPPEISALTQLQKLYLNDNQISSIPDSLSKLSRLKKLDLGDNQISSIPDSLNNLSQLKKLDLGNNQISSIPDSLSKLSQLQELNLDGNQISSIPDSLSKLSQLEWLSFDNNFQISSIPDWIGSLLKLQKLSLRNNQISSIPESLGNLSQLQGLYLEYNRISSIPESLGSLLKLQKLSLRSNQLSSIPDSLSKLSQLEWLCLSNNKISSIPDSLNNLSQLHGLYLDCNQIVSIPGSLLTNLPRLHTLHLQNNRINNIPDSLKKFSKLWLPLVGNPLLFIYDNSPSLNTLQLVAQCSEFKEYRCLSSFSNLCQLMVQKSDNHQMIKEAFGNLKKNDQNLIFEMICKESGVHSNEDPIFWGEHHVFYDMNIFYHAVKKAIAAKFDRLSSRERNAVYKEIYQLVQPEAKGLKWSEQHAFDNVLRLIDAMDRIGL
jgi:Leucine-rich repeat (LRR) protein